MTAAAWLMLAVTWGVIAFFTGRFFWMVLHTPLRADDAEGSAQRPGDVNRK